MSLTHKLIRIHNIEDELDKQIENLESEDELNDYQNVYHEHDSHDFLSEHPQYHPHKVTAVDEEHTLVPNFVGGGLPQCDQGDQEYYCSTMLTLFKPC